MYSFDTVKVYLHANPLTTYLPLDHAHPPVAGHD